MSDNPIVEKELEEKEMVRMFFENKRHGFFIEVGANEPDPVYSQSLHLEQYLDWKGLLIEPIDYLAERLKNERPRSKVIQVACTSPHKTGKTELIIPVSKNGDISGFASLEANIDHSLLFETRKLAVTAKTLSDIIQVHAEGESIDFLSIDVEGTELDVLQGADLTTFSPTLIIIEDRLVFLRKHLYLKKHGYKLFRRTGFNNWYAKKIPQNSTTLKNQLNLFRKIYLSSWIKRIRETFRMKTLKTFSQL
jgi:FkbM family methyltransferase